MPDSDPADVMQRFVDAMMQRDLDSARALMAGDTEGFQFDDNTPAACRVGEATIDGDVARVAVELDAVDADGATETDEMTFVLVTEEGGWKVDLGRTMQELMGVDPSELMDQMAEAMTEVAEGIGDAIGSAFEGAFGGEEEDETSGDGASGPVDRSGWFDDFRDAAESFESDHLASESDKITSALDAPVRFEMDWSSVENDTDALEEVARRVVAPLRSRICILDPAAAAVLAGKLTTIRVRRRHDTPTNLELHGTTLQVEYQPDEVRRFDFDVALDAALDLRRGPEIRRLRDQRLPRLQDEIGELLPLVIDVDWSPFEAIEDQQEALDALRRFDRDLLGSLHYALRGVREAVEIEGRIGRLRVVPVLDRDAAEVFAEGQDLVVRWPSDGESFLAADELESALIGVAAGVVGAMRGAEPPDLPPLPTGWLQQADAAREFPDLVALYRDEILPTEIARLQTIVQAPLPVEVKWGGLDGDPRAAAQLGARGLQRVCGAITMLNADEGDRTELARALQRVRIEFDADPAARSCRLANGRLTLTLAPAVGGAAFREHELLEVLRQAVGHYTRPMIESLERQAEGWAERLQDRLEAPIQYEFAWNAFTSFTERGNVRFALTIMKEHGVDSFYYALDDVCDDDDLLALVRRRVRKLRLEHVSDPEDKGLSANGSTLVLAQFLHEDYQGYLTQDEIEARVKELLPFMEDLDDLPEPAAEAPDDADDEDDDEDDGVDDEADQMAQLITQMRDQMFPQMVEQMQTVLQNPVELEVDWDQVTSMDRYTVLMTQIGNLMGGLSMLAYDETHGPALREKLNSLAVTHAAATSCTLVDGRLTIGLDLDATDGESGYDAMQLPEEVKPLLA